MFIGDWMERGERYWPEALAVVDAAKGEAGRFTYRAMNRRANRLARWLRDEAGVGRGDRVGLLAMNGVEALDALFACGKLGAVLVPFNWRSPPRELAPLLEKTGPKALIFGEDFREVAAAVLPEAPSVGRALHVGGDGAAGSASYERVVNAGRGLEVADRSIAEAAGSGGAGSGGAGSEATAAGGAPVQNDAVGAEDILLLLFTGGTTGLPKAAQISYRMIAWNTLNTLVHELTRGDVTITHTPMFHTGGLLVYTLPLLTIGGTVVIMRRWTPEDMLELIERERVTMLFCVPTQYQRMMDSPRFAGASLRSVRFLTSGGAPLPLPVIRRYREQHGVVFKQGFGMTEHGPGVFSMAPEFAEEKAGSIGRPNYFIDARVVGDDNRPVPAGEVGELVLKGPSASSGYFKDPEASRAAVDAEGWFHTGDLARVDEDGFYYVVDRKKDMFISGGENVYPVEIERALYEHAAVVECAVIGVPDEVWGEVGKAVVVLAAGATATEAELLEHCRGQLARYKVPRSVAFLEALPYSAAGKILKRELRARFVPS